MAGGPGVIRLALGQERQIGLEGLEHLGTVPALLRRLLRVVAHDVAAPALALADPDLLHLKVGGDPAVAPRPGQHLALDFLQPAYRHGQDVAAETSGELAEIARRVEAGITHQHAAAQSPGPEIILDPRDRGDIGGHVVALGESSFMAAVPE